MSEIPVLERHRLDELHALGTMAGTPLVKNVLTTFLNDLPGNVQRLREAVAAGDATAQKFIAHSFKASSAQLGAAALAAVCLQLEHADAAAAPALLVALDREVARVEPLLVVERDAAS